MVSAVAWAATAPSSTWTRVSSTDNALASNVESPRQYLRWEAPGEVNVTSIGKSNEARAKSSH